MNFLFVGNMTILSEKHVFINKDAEEDTAIQLQF